MNDPIADKITRIHTMLEDPNPWLREFHRGMASLSLTLLLIEYARAKAGITEPGLEPSRNALDALGPQYTWPLRELAPAEHRSQLP